MRYVIRASDDDLYRKLLAIVTKSNGHSLRVILPKRRVLAADDLPDTVISAVRQAGGIVGEDIQYDQESLGTAALQP
jgi:hypothetical protein